MPSSSGNSILVAERGRCRKGKGRQQETRAMILRPLIHLFRLEYPSWNREALCLAIRDLEERLGGGSSWKRGSAGKKIQGNRIAHFPESCATHYQVLESVLWETVFVLLSSINSAHLTSSPLQLENWKREPFIIFTWVALVANPRALQLYEPQLNRAALSIHCFKSDFSKELRKAISLMWLCKSPFQCICPFHFVLFSSLCDPAVRLCVRVHARIWSATWMLMPRS